MEIQEELAAQQHADDFNSRLSRLGAVSSPSLILSAFLPTDQGAGHHYYRALLQDLARRFHQREDDPRAEAATREVAIVREFLEKRRFDAPALAVFGCQPIRLFDVWRLADQVTPRLLLRETAELGPLQEQLRRHSPALVAVVDKEQARIFGVVLREVQEIVRVEGTPISRHKQGGWSATTLQRREDEHARSNLDRTASLLVRLLDAGYYRRLHLGGSTEARVQIEALLPRRARAVIGNQAPVPLYADRNEMLARVLGLAAEEG